MFTGGKLNIFWNFLSTGLRMVDKIFVKVKWIIFNVIIWLLWNIHGEWYRPVTGLLACFKMVKLLPDFDLFFIWGWDFIKPWFVWKGNIYACKNFQDFWRNYVLDHLQIFRLSGVFSWYCINLSWHYCPPQMAKIVF